VFHSFYYDLNILPYLIRYLLKTRNKKIKD